MVVNSNVKINISDKEKEELIKSFKIGVLCQLQKEGYITNEQLNKMIRDINSATFAQEKYNEIKELHYQPISYIASDL